MAKPLSAATDAAILNASRRDPAPSQRALAKEFDVSLSIVGTAIARATAAEAGAATAPRPLPVLPDIADHDAIVPSPLNPRKRFDPDSLVDLWASIKADGVLLPLLVRHHPDGSGLLEIIAGERRWRAVELGISRDEAERYFPMPVRLVDPCDDRKLLELALTENVARRDMTPLEEAEAFAALVGQGAAPSEIADVVGMNMRTVQKRLRLVKDLTPQTRDALAEGKITVEFANILAAYCPKSQQGEAVDAIRNGQVRTTGDLKRRVMDGRWPESAAFFDVAAYKGGWIEDEDEPGKRWFADGAQFQALQAKAVKAKAAELGKIYAWVKVLGKGDYFHVGEYQRTPAPGTAPGAVIEVKRDYQVIVHADLTRLADIKAKPSSTPGRPAVPAEPTTKGHNAAAHRRKTAALQTAMAAAPEMAMRATIMALLGATGAVHIKAEDHGREDQVAASVPRAVVDAFLSRCSHAAGRTVEYTPNRIRPKTAKNEWDYVSWDEAQVWALLCDVAGADLASLFAAIVALRAGSFAGFECGLGDSPVALAIAKSLGLVGAEDKHGLGLTIDDLDGIRRDTLADIARAAGVPGKPETMKTAALKEAIGESYPAGFVVPSLRFGAEADLKAMLKGKPHPAEVKAAFAAAAPGSRDKAFAEIVACTREFPPVSAAEVHLRIAQGINAWSGHPLDREIDTSRRFDPEDIGINPAPLLDGLFGVPPKGIDRLPNVGAAIAIACLHLEIVDRDVA